MAIKGSHHLITIAVPVPDNSVTEQHKVMSTYADALDALKAKLPRGHEWEDHIRKPRKEKAPEPRAVAAE